MRRRALVAMVVIAAITVVLAWIGQGLGASRPGRRPSSFSGGPEGLLGFRRLLDRLGRPVATLERPWAELDDLDPGGVVVLATPLSRPVADDEVEPMLRWLARGGGLLVVDDATAVERSEVLDRMLAGLGLEPVPPREVRLDPATLLPARPPLATASGARGLPLTDDLRSIGLHRSGGIVLDGDAVPLLLSGHGDVVGATGSDGDGRVVVVMGPLLANDRLLAGDTLRLALRLVDDLRGEGPVRFDEFHHGYGGILAAGGRLYARALPWAGAQALVALLAYALARGIRFGPPRLVPPPPRRSSLEFVDAMASLYRRARARGHVLRAMLERFERDARTRWELDEHVTVEELAGIAARRSGGDPRRYEDALVAARASAERPRLGEGEMLGRARALDAIETEVRRGHRQGT